MHTVAGAHVRPALEPDSPRAFLNAAGACTGALGTIDIVVGISMLASAGSYDATIDGAATAAAMRNYGVRMAMAGVVSLAFVWMVFAEPGIRSVWFMLPVGIALFDLAFDVAALSSGSIPSRTVSLIAALHEVLAAAVAAVAVAGWRRERAVRAARAASKPA